jgi:hypothetical protein
MRIIAGSDKLKNRPRNTPGKRFLIRLAVVLSLAPLTAWPGQTATVPSDLWEQPRTAQAVLAQPVLRQDVAALLSQPGTALAIHYGSGEETLLRAEELRAWLIALAVDAEQIVLVGDLPGIGELQIELTTKRGQQ